MQVDLHGIEKDNCPYLHVLRLRRKHGIDRANYPYLHVLKVKTYTV